jgi:hypothetical protein
MCKAQAGAHTGLVVALPGASMRPGWHNAQPTHAVAGFRSLSQVPLPQLWAVSVSPAQYSPALHTSHTVGEVEVAAAVCTVPAWHSPAGRHDDRLAEAE